MIEREMEDSFACDSRQEQLRRDLEIARQFFGEGMIQNPRVEEIKDGLKSEALGPRGNTDPNCVDLMEDDEDEIELEEGLI